MSIKVGLSKLYAKSIYRHIRTDADASIDKQSKVLSGLLKAAGNTVFGRDHRFTQIKNYTDFISAVPVRDYEQLSPYIERSKEGERDILWPGIPKYYCKTSGTTSGTKYIPITNDSLPNHIDSAKNALLCYIAETGNASFVGGKMIFLQGSPALGKLKSGIPYGRLSGIVANHVPVYLQKNRMPSYETNCIEDWELKVNSIAEETMHERMSLISGIPNWVQMYFEILLQKTGRNSIKEIFPDFSLFVYGGVNFEPYRKKFEELIGSPIPTIELYPASEGFIAYQDSRENEGLLLNTNSGIFFEFIEASDYYNESRRRLSLEEVKVGVNYALLLSSNAGLWSYSIGDTVKFVSLDPPRIKVTGRIKHFTSAFGEHVIAEEVEKAMSETCSALSITVNEFHVAPMVSPTSGLPYHEWFIESDEIPSDPNAFGMLIDNKMQAQNVYYKDLIQGKVLRPAVMSFVKRGAFNEYMKSVGKLGGQNKVPRLANDRKIADMLTRYLRIN